MSGSTRREQLLTVAAAVLEDHGLERLSMGAIARRAGIRPPSLYKHFAGKAEVEVRLTEYGFGLFTASVRQALARLGPEPTRRAAITAFARLYRAFGLAHPQLYRLMNGRRLPRELLTPGVEEAAMRDYLALVPDVDMARSLWAWAHGLLSLELVDRYPPGADLDAAWQVLIDTASHGLLEGSAAPHRPWRHG